VGVRCQYGITSRASLWQIELTVSNPRKKCSPLIGSKVVWLLISVLGVAEGNAIYEQCDFDTPAVA